MEEHSHDQKETSKRKPLPKLLQIKDDGIDYKFLNIAIRILALVGGILLFSLLVTLVGGPLFKAVGRLVTLLMPFILALVISTILYPMVMKAKLSKKKAAVLITFVFIIVFTGMILGTFYVVGNTIQNFMVNALSQQSAGTLTGASEFVFNNLKDLELFGLRVLQSDMTFNPGFLVQQVQNNYTLVYSYVLMLASMFFILPNAPKASAFFKKMIPKKFREESSIIMDIFSNAFSNYMRGQLFIASIVGLASATAVLIAGAFGWFVLGYKDFALADSFILSFFPENLTLLIATILVFGIICAVTNLIPMIGPLIGGVVVVPLIFFSEITVIPENEWPWISFMVAGLIIVVQQTESMFLQPRVMSKAAKIDGLMVLIGIAVFGGLFGVIGMIISTPILSSTKQIITYYNEQYEIF